MASDDVIFVGYMVSLPEPATDAWEGGSFPRSIGFGENLPQSWCLDFLQSPPPGPEQTFAALASRSGVCDAPALSALTCRAFEEGSLIAQQFFQRAESVRELLALLPAGGLRVFGVGLRDDDLRALFAIYRDWSEPGATLARLLRERPAMPRGLARGWELNVANEYNPTEFSWLHNFVHREALARGYPLVEGAFLSDYEHALTLAGEMNGGRIGAEPGLWLPWFVSDCSAAFGL